MTQTAPSLRLEAEEAAARLPDLLAHADHLASTVLLGTHGRRRAGLGDDFWQYRPARPGDSRRMIDWRRSARGDTQFVREREWQIAQTVQLWIDQAGSMRFTSGQHPDKAHRARLVGLALAVLLLRSGERVGLTGTRLPPRRGDIQILRLAEMFLDAEDADYSPPEHRGMLPRSQAVFVSDFLGEIDEVETALTKAADRGVRGVLLQILDPVEENFPFRGRAIFQSVGGSLAHETLKADDLRDRYLDRLAERKARLSHLSSVTGWQYHCHHTDQSAQAALMWLYHALDRRL
ncbi:DUF58 domain-containing protein [Pseudaestuariivita atlantica]|uniref:Membrane protein n=1 Tax=Pseudaestuariivita atlantica TaxID=1317121 RepID=A0A0L1JPV4_9RHOB|nr:DUF58 domain-containing protein [Pseudaestuariivita atlantica]KNG93766.1 membrane protein [Pseudaestuariivita atlantica]